MFQRMEPTVWLHLENWLCVKVDGALAFKKETNTDMPKNLHSIT